MNYLTENQARPRLLKQNHPKKQNLRKNVFFLWRFSARGVHVIFLTKKLRGGGGTFPLLFFSFDCFNLFIAFLAVSLHEELNNTTKTFPKNINPEIPKNQKLPKGSGCR
jgi:hypothetical protein